MAELGTLRYNIDANTVKLQRELLKAQKKTEQTAKSMHRSFSSSFGKIQRAALRVGAAIGVGLSVQQIRETLKVVDSFGKLTDRLGGTTEAFSELQFVAERSGVTFQTMTMGLQRMSRRVAEAAVGTGEAKGALQELNLSAKKLTELPIDKQFEAIADALALVKNDGDQTRLAMKLFDSEGVALLQTMTNGAAGIRELRQEAKDLGVSLSTEQVEAATRANDAITSLGAAVSATARAMVVEMSPAIEGVAESLQNWFAMSRSVEIAREMDKLRGQIKDLSNSAGNSEYVKILSDKFFVLARELEGLKSGAGAAGPAVEEIGEIIVTAKKKTGDYTEGLAQFAKGFETAAEQAAKLRAELEFYRSGMSEGQIANAEAQIQEILTGGLEEIRLSSLPKLKVATKETTDAMSVYADQAARNIQDTFADFLFDPFDQGLKGMLQGFIDTLRRMVAEAASAFVLNMLFKGTPLEGFFPGLGKRAAGGPVSSGTPYMVGEKGPELFVPNGSGTIVPNHKLTGGGVTVVQNNNIDARGATQDVIKMLPGILAQNRAAAVNEVRELVRRGSL